MHRSVFAFLSVAMVPFMVQAEEAAPAPLLLGESVKVGQLPAGYNQSAAYQCADGWDLFLTGDYIWWNWMQGSSMLIKVPSGQNMLSATNITVSPEVISPGYASGFQVGFGFNMRGMDDWSFYGEYTWYKNSGSNTLDRSLEGTSPGISGSVNMTGDMSIAYNNADFLLQRPFYLGRKLTANYFAGLKALWITNDSSRSGSASISEPFSYMTSMDLTSYNNTLHVSSWSLGPKFGFDANWLLGYGLKFISNISASVIYASYTGTSTTAIAGTTTNANDQVLSLDNTTVVEISNYPSLRPIFETYLGLGWGSYFSDNRCHFDLSIGYDFNALNTAKVIGSDNQGSAIFLHGLNVQMRFDF